MQQDDLGKTINTEAVELVNHIRCSTAPEEVLGEAIEHIRQAMDKLSPWLKQGEGWSTISIASDVPGFGWRDDDLTACMPYSPVSGSHNPVAPPIKMWRSGEDGNEVEGEVTFSPTYAGPPDSVHGGIIAAVFDELLSMANIINNTAGFTGTLSIRYHKKTPLDTPLQLWAKNVRTDGRKLICEGEIRVNGEVTASAEGLFISASTEALQPERGDK